MINMKFLTTILCVFLIISCSRKTGSITENIQSDISTIEMRSVVKFLASDDLEGRLVGTPGEVKAAKWIADRYQEIGLVSMKEYEGYYHRFTLNKKPNPHSLTPTGEINTMNIVGHIDNKTEHTVIIGAHYDHLGYGHFGTLWDGDPEVHNGADDNASGVAVLLSVAKELVNGPKNNNYIIMAFSGEEEGLWGSNYWVKNANIDLSTINYMINLDMVGRLNTERSLAISGTGTSPTWEKHLDKTNKFNFKLVKKESGVGPSDHTSFYNNDIPVLHFFTGQHSDYHKPSDDYEKVNFKGMKDIAMYITDLVSRLDGKGKLKFTKTVDESDAVPDFKVTLGVMPDYLFDGKGMRIDGVKDNRPASNAGIEKGDVVIKMGDLNISNMMSYMEALSAFNPGETVDVIIERNGKELSKKVTF